MQNLEASQVKVGDVETKVNQKNTSCQCVIELKVILKKLQMKYECLERFFFTKTTKLLVEDARSLLGHLVGLHRQLTRGLQDQHNGSCGRLEPGGTGIVSLAAKRPLK